MPRHCAPVRGRGAGHLDRSWHSAADIARWLGPGVPLIRTMPNRPALIGAGITALFARPGSSAGARKTAEAILAACGPTVWVPYEDQIDVVTAVSGSGPAYFFLLVECLEAAGIELGLDPATARKLAIETARGAGRMAAEAPESPAELRAQVTSKGGTTAAALAVLEAAGVRGIFAARSRPARGARPHWPTNSARFDTANRTGPEPSHAGPAFHPQRAVHADRDRFPAAVLMPLVRADFRNPVGEAVLKLTNPLVLPLRKVLPPGKRFDPASLVALLVVQFAGTAVLRVVAGCRASPRAILIGGLRTC